MDEVIATRRPRFRLTEERKRTLTLAAEAFIANKVLVLAAVILATHSIWKNWSFLRVAHYLFVDNFRGWDANVNSGYAGIAMHGYATVKSTAFFPGYPLLMRGVSWITRLSPLAAGVLISHVAFFLLLYFFVRLAALDYEWKATQRAAVLLAVFPTAFYFSAPYTEATFMLASVLALLAMRTGKWARAGIWGSVAAAVRNSGVFLGLPFLVEYWVALREKKSSWKTWRRAAWVLLIVAGLAAYVTYLWVGKGNPLSFSQEQKAYGRGTEMPWGTLYHGYAYGLRALIHLHRPLDWHQIYYITELFFPSLVLVVLVTSFRKIRWSYWLIILYSLVFPLLAPANAGAGVPSKVIDYFVSFSRYSLVIVPLYFGLQKLLSNRWVFGVYVVFSAAFMLLLAYAFSRHWWVA